ncbi:uncharacterized protein [Chelonus insularis]|uniref:uncharacterized protein n=1 Tax=Chelonus insularis TaxID=460826 RepID=UPI00158DEB52|nr:uncharacterized protein LOC118070086 [Chelonus insularis]
MERIFRRSNKRLPRILQTNRGREFLGSDFTPTKRYIHVSQKIVTAYNNTKHSATKLTPVEIYFNNKLTAFLNMKHRYKNNKRCIKSSKKPKYSVGDLGRVSKAKAAFTKGYTSGWSKEIFKIICISTFRQQPVYILQDLDYKNIDSIFYAEEISKVSRKLQQQK